jgi:hypothetical protein
MDKCDYDNVGHSLMIGVGGNTKRIVRSDNTLHDYAMQPPVHVTEHAKRRLRERHNEGTVPVYAPGTRQSVIVTHIARKPLILKLRTPASWVIGKGGENIKAVCRASGARIHVEKTRVKIRGSNTQRQHAANLLKEFTC